MNVFHESTFRYPDSYQKTLHQISVVASQGLTIGSKVFEPPSELNLSTTFYRVWGCHLGCGACCPAFSLDYLPSEVPTLLGFYPHLEAFLLQRDSIPVNGEVFPVWSIMQEPQYFHDKPFCRFLDPKDQSCGIHKMNPFSCQVELVKFRKVKEKGYIMKAPFGRAWTMLNAGTGLKRDIRCTFESQDPKDQIINQDLPALKRMLTWAEYFKVPTVLPEVIEYLKEYVK